MLSYAKIAAGSDPSDRKPGHQAALCYESQNKKQKQKRPYSCGAEVLVEIDIITEVYFKGLPGPPFTGLLVGQMVHCRARGT